MDNIELLKQEEKELNERLKIGLKDYSKFKKEESIVTGLLEKFEKLVEHVKGYRPPETVVDFPKQMEVTGKVSILDSIKAIVKFPDIQKIAGSVLVKNFPTIFKVEGRVKADVDFPSVQEIKGKVDVLFPKKQTVEMDLSKVIKAIEDGKVVFSEGVEPDKNKANPTKYLPVRLTNGKAFYEIFERVGQSNGKLNALLEKLLIKPTDDIIKEQVLIDDVTTTNMTYVGTAPIGTATSSPSWTIKRLDESGTPTTLIVKWASAGVATCIWDNRASLSYS